MSISPEDIQNIVKNVHDHFHGIGHPTEKAKIEKIVSELTHDAVVFDLIEPLVIKEIKRPDTIIFTNGVEK